MSSDESPNVPDRDRREAVREKAQQVKAQQSRSRAIRRTSIITGIVAIVAVIAVGVTWAFASAASRPDLSPSNLTKDGFVVTTVSGVTDPGGAGVDGSTPAATDSPSATPTAKPSPSASATPAAGDVDIRVYVDYLSPGAKDFQVANMQQLTKWVTQDAATLTYYPVAMLAAKSNGTKYSLRAASASACVATHDPAKFFAYNDALLRNQPDPDADGMSDQQLADLAIASGVDTPKTVRDCIEDEDYASWAKAATDRALAGLPGTKGVKLTGSPMVLVNGTPYQGALDDPKEFAQFVLTIASDAYYKTPAPTDSPTATATATATP
jgi:protein-disulfide isomerase